MNEEAQSSAELLAFREGDWALLRWDEGGNPRVVRVWDKVDGSYLPVMLKFFETILADPDHPLKDIVSRLKAELNGQ